MPPGTGDTQLTFSQEIKMDGVIIVSTPQEIALQDVKRGIRMFDKLKVKIIGLIDNMSYFIGDDGKKYNIFGEGGVKKTAEEFNKEFLGEIPINPSGGLKSKGHPVGATGVGQIVEVFEQLTGKAGKRQVDDARIGLTHNVGATGGSCAVHIFVSE